MITSSICHIESIVIMPDCQWLPMMAGRNILWQVNMQHITLILVDIFQATLSNKNSN